MLLEAFNDFMRKTTGIESVREREEIDRERDRETERDTEREREGDRVTRM